MRVLAPREGERTALITSISLDIAGSFIKTEEAYTFLRPSCSLL
jgi:hypothetical protein